MKTWQIVAVVLIAVFAFALINWCRMGGTFHIVQSLPLLGGYRPGLHDIAGLVLVLLTINGIRKIRRNGDE